MQNKKTMCIFEYQIKRNMGTLNAKQSLKELKSNGVKAVYLNGFIERINYVLTLENVTYVGKVKSDDGYNFIESYTTYVS